MTFIIPDPYGLSWTQWSNTVTGFNPQFIQYVSPGMEWSAFADALTYALPQTPRADIFSNWQEWASALRQVAG